MIPLFLGGSNGEHNLQALCPSCDRFKTSYLDYKVLKPLSETKTLQVEDVLQAQKNNYHKMMCSDPNKETQTSIQCNQYIRADQNHIYSISADNQNTKDLSFEINGVKVRIGI